MKYLQLLVLAILLIAPASLGYADLVTYNFTGSITAITENQNNAIPNLDVGDTFTGYTTFEASGWQQSNGTMQVTLNGINLLFTGSYLYGQATLGPNSYSLRVAADTGGSITGSTFSAGNFGLDLRDLNGSAGITQTLPASLDLSEFETNTFRIWGTHIGTNSIINLTGKLDTFAAVPEPASALVLFGAVSSCLIRRRLRKAYPKAAL